MDVTCSCQKMLLNKSCIFFILICISNVTTQSSDDNVTYERLSDPVVRVIQENCRSNMAAIRLLPMGLVVPEAFVDIVGRIKDMDVRADDVWIITYPKSGTTWTQEMIWLFENNLNFSQAKSTELSKRSPYLENTGLRPKGSAEAGDSVSDVKQAKSPRVLKTHLPKSLLPNKLFEVNPKVIYVIRNVKDVAVSYYYHFVLTQSYTGSKEDFYEAFIQDKVTYSPYWEHVLDYWELRQSPNVLLLTYEEMNENLSEVLDKTAEFLGVLEMFCDENQKLKLLNHLDFDVMRNNAMVNFAQKIKDMGKGDTKWLRKGKVGGWINEMSKEMSTRFDNWTREKLQGSDFVYKYYNEDYEARIESQKEGT